MLTTLILVAFVMLIAFGAMAVGVLLGRSPIKGSCGGIGAGEDCPCGRKADDTCKRRGLTLPVHDD